MLGCLALRDGVFWCLSDNDFAVSLPKSAAAAQPRYLPGLVPVILRLVRPFDGYADVLGLLLRELRQLHAEFCQMQSSDLFVELLGKYVDADLEGVRLGPQ